MRVAKSGDHLVLELPDTVVEALALAEGDELMVRIEGKQMSSTQLAERRAWALEKLVNLRIKLPADWKFDREEANSR
ncbi:AbrB family transcriptional regulator [Rhizobium sp. TH2]|uniref:AbrB family transcriptional regulator n=1 Tax=Rhizobium sp. TH2 TaxID=2775403 RepID=UPI0021577557|nr:AbrB family transcriptional regulator [Rhizobium sp. TH2]UVC07163.1 AbrB family transcriptional regulator [Rhizobium sp. TH2]